MRYGAVPLALSLLAAFLGSSSPAQSAPDDRRCVLLVLPAGGWADLAPPVREALLGLAAEGAAGSMSCAVPQPMTEAAAWVTLGAGNRARWPRELDEPFRGPLSPSTLAQALDDANRSLPYPIEVGSLGQALHERGLRTAVVGCFQPWHTAAAMDRSGHVDLLTVEAAPSHLREFLGSSRYVVIVGSALPNGEALAGLIGWLGRTVRATDLLVVAGLAPRQAPFIGLTPIVIRGPGFRGVLTSANTRRPGVVANIDLPPTVLTHFGLPLPASYTNGEPVTSLPGRGFSAAEAMWLDAKGRQADALRPLAIPVLFVLQVLLVVAGFRPASLRGRRLLTRAMLGLMVLPAATYVVAAVPSDWPGAVVVAGVLALGAAVAVALPPERPRGMVALVCALTAGLLAVDVARGAPWQPVSLIGYSLGLGGRFWGLGNEAAGLMIAAAAVLVGVWLAPVGTAEAGAARWRLAGAAVLLLAIVLVAGHPALGGNAGCVLFGVVCFGALGAARVRGRGAWLVGLLVIGGAVALLFAIAYLDSLRGPQEMTHIGRAWLRLTTEGWRYVSEFARRRLTTAWLGLIATPASLVAGAWVLFWSYAILRPLGFVRRACDGLPGLRTALAAVVIGGLAACVLEDSTMAIPTMMLSVALPTLGLAAQSPPPEPGEGVRRGRPSRRAEARRCTDE